MAIQAEKQGVTPEALAANYQESHSSHFKQFNINFDHYPTTHSPENEELVGLIDKALKAQGDIITKTIG